MTEGRFGMSESTNVAAFVFCCDPVHPTCHTRHRCHPYVHTSLIPLQPPDVSIDGSRHMAAHRLPILHLPAIMIHLNELTSLGESNQHQGFGSSSSQLGSVRFGFDLVRFARIRFVAGAARTCICRKLSRSAVQSQYQLDPLRMRHGIAPLSARGRGPPRVLDFRACQLPGEISMHRPGRKAQSRDEKIRPTHHYRVNQLQKMILAMRAARNPDPSSQASHPDVILSRHGLDCFIHCLLTWLTMPV